MIIETAGAKHNEAAKRKVAQITIRYFLKKEAASSEGIFKIKNFIAFDERNLNLGMGATTKGEIKNKNAKKYDLWQIEIKKNGNDMAEYSMENKINALLSSNR